MASGASTASGVSSQSAGLDSLISPTEVLLDSLRPRAAPDLDFSKLTTLPLLQEHYARQQKYMAGSLLTEAEDEDVPLFYFNNPLKFLKWVSSWAIPG